MLQENLMKSKMIILEEHSIISELFLILFTTNYSKNYSGLGMHNVRLPKYAMQNPITNLGSLDA